MCAHEQVSEDCSHEQIEHFIFIFDRYIGPNVEAYDNEKGSQNNTIRQGLMAVPVLAHVCTRDCRIPPLGLTLGQFGEPSQLHESRNREAVALSEVPACWVRAVCS